MKKKLKRQLERERALQAEQPKVADTSTEKSSGRWFFPTLVGPPILFFLVMTFFPIGFVRLAGCTGDLNGVAVSGDKLVIGEHVYMSAKRGNAWDVEKVSLRDPVSGSQVGGPWVHDARGWVGMLGDLYCVSGDSLECASVADGKIVVSRQTLEAKEPRLIGHWLHDPREYNLVADDQIVFKTDDGRFWLLNRALALSETDDTTFQTLYAAHRDLRPKTDGPQIGFVGQGRQQLKEYPDGGVTQQSWLEPAFVTDEVTAQTVHLASGWLMTSAERRVYAGREGVSVSAVDDHGKEKWKVPIGDFYSVHSARMVDGVLVLECWSGHENLRALDPATGKQLWLKSYGLW